MFGQEGEPGVQSWGPSLPPSFSGSVRTSRTFTSKRRVFAGQRVVHVDLHVFIVVADDDEEHQRAAVGDRAVGAAYLQLDLLRELLAADLLDELGVARAVGLLGKTMMSAVAPGSRPSSPFSSPGMISPSRRRT